MKNKKKKVVTGYIIDYGQSLDDLLMYKEGNGGVEVIKLEQLFKNKRTITDILPLQLKDRIKKIKLTLEDG